MAKGAPHAEGDSGKKIMIPHVRKISKIVLLALILGMSVTTYFLYPPRPHSVTFPDGKRFAFSIVDDTDMATLERVKPLYELLDRYKIYTTKTVWVLEGSELSHEPNRGDSLRDPEYRAFMQELQGKGFEIALHGVRGGNQYTPGHRRRA